MEDCRSYYSKNGQNFSRNIFTWCIEWVELARCSDYVAKTLSTIGKGNQLAVIRTIDRRDYMRLYETVLKHERKKNVTYQMSRRGWPCAPCWYSQGFLRVGVAVEAAAAWRSPCPCCLLNFDVTHNEIRNLPQRKHISRNVRVDDPVVRRKTYVCLYAWQDLFGILTILRMESHVSRTGENTDCPDCHEG